MARTLYEIDQDILNLLQINDDEMVNVETGEVFGLDALTNLQMERQDKLENVALYIKELVYEEAALKAEAKKLTERAKAKAKKQEALSNWLKVALQGEKLESNRVVISYRKSESLEVTDEEAAIAYLVQYNENALKYKNPEISKTIVKQMLKDGEVVPGVMLSSNSNIQIR